MYYTRLPYCAAIKKDGKPCNQKIPTTGRTDPTGYLISYNQKEPFHLCNDHLKEFFRLAYYKEVTIPFQTQDRKHIRVKLTREPYTKNTYKLTFPLIAERVKE